MGSAQSGDGDGPILGINVTPLVDVTLVLLIVFMITAKMIVQQGIPLDLPHASTTTKVDSTITVTIDAQGAMAVDGRPIANGAALTQAAREAHARGPEVKAVIRAPASATHGSVVTAMDALRRGEVTRIALATEKSAAGTPAQ
jgi:biopolymer transport protein ExbD